MEAPHRRIDRPTAIAIAVTAVIVAAAAVMVLVSGEPERLDPSTPEGVVQRYTDAILADDRPEALEFLTSASKRSQSCQDSDFLMRDDDVRVVLVDTRVEGDTATVEVRMTFRSGDGPFGGEWSEEDRFGLVFDDGSWLIDQVPWQLRICP